MAKVTILVQGFTNADAKAASGQEKTCPTITLVREKDMVMVVDPGVLDDQKILVNALAQEGLTPNDVTIVALTHSHIDHYRNAGMFRNAKTLEFFGVWDGGKVEDWQENFTPDIQILKTPGHDYSSITLFIKTENGTVAICGDVFWKENSPEFDPYASDPEKLENSRQLVKKMSQWIIPGHGAMFAAKNVPAKQMQGAPGADDKAKPLEVGACKKCHRALRKATDKCQCQDWLCYRCCECEADCPVCNCKVRR